MGIFNRAGLKVAFGIGKLAGVEQKLDTYRDFYLTSYELVNPGNVHPKQFELLAKDPKFKDQECYLVTAATQNKHGELVQRKFLLNKGQARKIGLLDLKEGKETGPSPQVILNQKFTFETYGQYLENMFGVRLAKIYPRVQNVMAQPAEGESMNMALREGAVKKDLVFRFWGGKKKGNTPAP
ncbi:MAG: hypothetical protein PHY92_06965 [Alphaproteobacteria bacterium]|nr:hypothetical protein [Alphaproteobacteria bacterium]